MARRTGLVIIAGLVVLGALAATANAHESAQAAKKSKKKKRSSAPSLAKLPVGDQKFLTSGAKRGFIFLCTQGGGAGGGAGTQGPWFNGDGTYNYTTKAVVDGNNPWPQATFSNQLSGSNRTVTGNGLPTSHGTGNFPIQPSDDAYQFDRNPNSVGAQNLRIQLPGSPQKAASAGCMRGEVGIALNGVPIFNAFDAANRDGVAWEVQDSCQGHPQNTRQYHYHNISSCLTQGESKKKHSSQVGFAFDGFGIFGTRGEDGIVLSNKDLDACHGHTHKVSFNGKKQKIYHYHATREFPYTVSCFRGTPIQTQIGGMGGGPPPPM